MMYRYKTITLPNNAKTLLLHACCAPCSAAIMETLIANSITYTIFFYNPNIHPIEEYEKRKQDIKIFAKKNNIDFIDADYEENVWHEITKELAKEPERGKRCNVCFQLRLDNTAKYCKEHDFLIFATTLGISRHKNLQVVNDCGLIAANKYKVTYWDVNWRKICSPQSIKFISNRENFYRQKYCGCRYSERGKK